MLIRQNHLTLMGGTMMDINKGDMVITPNGRVFEISSKWISDYSANRTVFEPDSYIKADEPLRAKVESEPTSESLQKEALSGGLKS